MDGVLHFFLGPDLGVYYDGSVWELLFFFFGNILDVGGI